MPSRQPCVFHLPAPLYLAGLPLENQPKFNGTVDALTVIQITFFFFFLVGNMHTRAACEHSCTTVLVEANACMALPMLGSQEC